MPTNMRELIGAMSPEAQKRIEERAAELIAEEMTLRDLRKARNLTQVKMAKKLGVTQDKISRLESRSDLLLSTLEKVVGGMGGELKLVAQFKDRAPVVISGIGALLPASGRKLRRPQAGARKIAKTGKRF